jgi:hypothetical protein
LPPDIVIETLLSTGLLLVGIVLGSPQLRPIEWAAWAGETEKDTRRPKGKKLFEGDGGAEGGGVAWLEDRKGFWDIRVGHILLSELRNLTNAGQARGICIMGAKWNRFLINIDQS